MSGARVAGHGLWVPMFVIGPVVFFARNAWLPSDCDLFCSGRACLCLIPLDFVRDPWLSPDSTRLGFALFVFDSLCFWLLGVLDYRQVVRPLGLALFVFDFFCFV